MSQQNHSQVSDEDAIRALLSSAEARAKEREVSSSTRDLSSHQKGRRGGRWGDKDSNDSHNNRNRDNQYDHRDKRYRSSEQGKGEGSNNNNETYSYYGPNNNNSNARKRPRQEESQDGQRHRNRDRNSSSIPQVEPDETVLAKHDIEKEDEKPKPQYKPNFGLSGTLSKDTQSGNVYKGVVLKFKEPPEARAPNTQWRFYVFKKGQKDVTETLHISKQSAYLMGRNADIADIAMYHPSLSSQHAVLQYRALPKDGRLVCQPYIMDLESTNGTFLNGIRIDPARYYQLKKGDVLSFGASTREYVLLTENTTSAI